MILQPRLVTPESRNRFNHISPEDALNLKSRIHDPDLVWMEAYSIVPVLSSLLSIKLSLNHFSSLLTAAVEIPSPSITFQQSKFR